MAAEAASSDLKFWEQHASFQKEIMWEIELTLEIQLLDVSRKAFWTSEPVTFRKVRFCDIPSLDAPKDRRSLGVGNVTACRTDLPPDHYCLHPELIGEVWVKHPGNHESHYVNMLRDFDFKNGQWEIGPKRAVIYTSLYRALLQELYGPSFLEDLWS